VIHYPISRPLTSKIRSW